MSVDYRAIAGDEARLQRTATNSIRTLANLYAERSHFVFELLQNAEDALGDDQARGKVHAQSSSTYSTIVLMSRIMAPHSASGMSKRFVVSAKRPRSLRTSAALA